MMYRNLIPLLWLAWGAYWFAASVGAKPARRQVSVLSRAAHITPLAIAVLLDTVRPGPFVPGWSQWLLQSLWPQGAATDWAGTLILAAGLAFAIWARVILGGNWSGTVTIKENHELIRTGPYRWVRHPIYTGILIGFLGTAIALDQSLGFIALALCFYAFRRKIRLEEEWMMEVFGESYAGYRADVPALIPFIR
jgi:protein-S-isoprenylcysteine O-methyltransferase Ste14